MARPSKGARVAFTFRLPVELAERIASLDVPERNAWIVDAIETKLKDVTNGERASEAPG